MPKTPTKTSKKKKFNSRFPPARIKKIMQKDEDVGKVAAAVPVIISRALELFIESLIMETSAIIASKSAKTLSASHIKQTICGNKQFDFLRDLVENVAEHNTEENKESSNNGDTSVTNGDAPQKRARGRPRKNKDLWSGTSKQGQSSKSTPDTSDNDDNGEEDEEETESDNPPEDDDNGEHREQKPLQIQDNQIMSERVPPPSSSVGGAMPSHSLDNSIKSEKLLQSVSGPSTAAASSFDSEASRVSVPNPLNGSSHKPVVSEQQQQLALTQPYEGSHPLMPPPPMMSHAGLQYHLPLPPASAVSASAQLLSAAAAAATGATYPPPPAYFYPPPQQHHPMPSPSTTDYNNMPCQHHPHPLHQHQQHPYHLGPLGPHLGPLAHMSPHQYQPSPYIQAPPLQPHQRVTQGENQQPINLSMSTTPQQATAHMHYHHPSNPS